MLWADDDDEREGKAQGKVLLNFARKEEKSKYYFINKLLLPSSLRHKSL